MVLFSFFICWTWVRHVLFHSFMDLFVWWWMDYLCVCRGIASSWPALGQIGTGTRLCKTTVAQLLHNSLPPWLQSTCKTNKQMTLDPPGSNPMVRARSVLARLQFVYISTYGNCRRLLEYWEKLEGNKVRAEVRFESQHEFVLSRQLLNARLALIKKQLCN